MRTINKGVDDKMQKIVNTVDTLKSLPQGNYFLPNYQLIKNVNNPAEIYDLFLHDQDRSYTIPECYDFAASASLNITEFFMGLGFGKKSDFLPSRYIKDEKLLGKIAKLPLAKQHAIAEIMHSRMTKHSFYCMKKHPPKIEFGLDVIPSFSIIFPSNYGATLADEIVKVPDVLNMGFMNINIPIFKTPNVAEILRNIDGKKTVGEIIEGKDFYDEFKAMYENLNDHYLLFLRQAGLPPYKTVEEMQRRVSV
jgi:predicted transcriptional regulator